MNLRTLLAIALLLLASTAVAQHDHHHDAYFDSGSSDDGSDWLANGDTFEFTFDEGAGTFGYHCHPHPDMVGSITVEGHEHGDGMDHDDSMEQGTVHEVAIVDNAQGLAFEDWGFEPAELTIQMGDTVRWTNTGNVPHTVTATDPAPHGHEHNDAPGVGGFLAFAAVALLAAVIQRR